MEKLNRVTAVILFFFLAVSLSLIYWTVVRGDTILAREDNPRLVEAELRIQRGQIVDRNGVVLAETVGEPDRLDRIYPIPNIGPAVGYYSFRHGTSGVEEGFDELLRGETAVSSQQLRRQILHEIQTGQSIQLTLDAELQQVADELMPNTPSAMILLDLQGDVAQILTLVSHPAYDPNLLDEQFDELSEGETAPLLNRVIQGQYQPGLLLQPFILAGAQEQGAISITDIVLDADSFVGLNGYAAYCEGDLSNVANWGDVLWARCPAPMEQLGDQLGATGLEQIFNDFGLTAVPNLSLNIELPELELLADPLLAGVGQDNLLVTPLQVGVAWLALGNNGRLPTLQLVTAVQDGTGEWQPVPREEVEELTAVSATTAQFIRRYLPQTDNIFEHRVRVLSGPEGEMNSWYLGLAPATNPRFAIVIVVEDENNLLLIEEIGRQILTLAQEDDAEQ